MTINELAADYSRRFEKAKRDDGSEYWRVKTTGEETEALTALCHTAHGDMLPDDWRYEFIVEALSALADHEDTEDARDSIEADIYTHELTSWLGSRADRDGYCDEAAEEFGVTDGNGRDFIGTVKLLQLGQWTEKREVFESVLSSLRQQVEALEEA